MSQFKNYAIGLILFVLLIMPALLVISIDHVHRSAFMKMTAEVGEVVKGEGGVTDEVKRIVSGLEGRGYTIRFTDEHGNIVNDKVFFGDKIIIHYEYEYHIQEEKKLRTTNNVSILRR